MRTTTAILCLALTTLVLVSCDQQHAALDVDPSLGRDCFEMHRPSLPIGTQYEGIERATGDRITIKVMTGVELTTTECAMTPEGMLQNTRE